MSQYILSDSNTNDIAASEIYEIQNFLLTPKVIHRHQDLITRANTRPIMPINILSESLKTTDILLYDNPFLLNHYPNGLVTESFILLPIEHFHNMREQFSILRETKKQDYLTEEEKALLPKEYSLQNNWIHWATSLINPLMQNLELKLNIDIPQNEKDLINKHISHNFDKEDNIDKDMLPSLSKVHNVDLLNLIQSQDFSFASVLQNHISVAQESSVLFKEFLKESCDYMIDLPTIANGLNTSNKSSSDNDLSHIQNIDVDTVINDINKYYDFECSILTPFNKISKIIDAAKEASQGDPLLFTEKAKDTLFPILAEAHGNLFTLSVNHIKQSVFNDSDKNDKVTLQSMENFCLQFVEVCNQEQRGVMIKIITDFSIIDRLCLTGDKELKAEKLMKQDTNKLKM